MCGIFGVMIHGSDAQPERARLEETARRLRHRGPDAHGIHADRHVGLVHTRLSLLDLDPRSNQPFWDSERRYALVYNGEIFNYQELRADCQRRSAIGRNAVFPPAPSSACTWTNRCSPAHGWRRASNWVNARSVSSASGPIRA